MDFSEPYCAAAQMAQSSTRQHAPGELPIVQCSAVFIHSADHARTQCSAGPFNDSGENATIAHCLAAAAFGAAPPNFGEPNDGT